MKTEVRMLKVIWEEQKPFMWLLGFMGLCFPIGVAMLVGVSTWQFWLFTFMGYSCAFIGFLAACCSGFYGDLAPRQHFFRRLIERYSNEAIIIRADGQSKNIYVTPALSRLLGFSITQLRSLQLEKLVNRADMPRFIALISAMRAESSENLRLKTAKGSTIWVEMNIRSIQNQDGTNYQLFSLRDVSERMELEQSTRRFAEELRRQARFTNPQVAAAC